MHGGGLAHLWSPLRIDPALDHDAQAPHPAEEGQQFPIGVRKRVERFVVALRSHSTGPRHAVSKSRSSSPADPLSQFPV
jgi:hypothetical protein